MGFFKDVKKSAKKHVNKKVNSVKKNVNKKVSSAKNKVNAKYQKAVLPLSKAKASINSHISAFKKASNVDDSEILYTLLEKEAAKKCYSKKEKDDMQDVKRLVGKNYC